MNISNTWHTDLTHLPRTSVELARILKAVQTGSHAVNVAGQGLPKSAYTISRDAVPTYARNGNRVTLKRNLTGALVDIRA